MLDRLKALARKRDPRVAPIRVLTYKGVTPFTTAVAREGELRLAFPWAASLPFWHQSSACVANADDRPMPGPGTILLAWITQRGHANPYPHRWLVRTFVAPLFDAGIPCVDEPADIRHCVTPGSIEARSPFVIHPAQFGWLSGHSATARQWEQLITQSRSEYTAWLRSHGVSTANAYNF